jgi:hypothetical protein
MHGHVNVKIQRIFTIYNSRVIYHISYNETEGPLRNSILRVKSTALLAKWQSLLLNMLHFQVIQYQKSFRIPHPPREKKIMDISEKEWKYCNITCRVLSITFIIYEYTIS